MSKHPVVVHPSRFARRRFRSIIFSAFAIMYARAWLEVMFGGAISHPGVYCVKFRPSDMRGGHISNARMLLILFTGA